MESPITVQATKTTSSHSSDSDAPLLNLLSQPLTNMTMEELRSHVQELREVSSSSIALKKKISNDLQANKPTKAKVEVDAKKLLSKYLNM